MSGRQQELVTKPSITKSRDEQVEVGYEYDKSVQQSHDSRNKQPSRYQDGQVEFGYEYEKSVQHSHDSRNKQPSRYQENLSHHHGRSREKEIPDNLHERREYEWNVRYDRGGKVHSRQALPVGRLEKKPRNDERVLHINPPRVNNQRRNDYAGYADYNDSRERYGYEDYTKDGHRRPEHAEYEEYDNVHGQYDYAEYEDYNNEAIRKSNHGYVYDESVEIRKEEYTDGRFLVENEHGAMARNLVPVEVGGHVQGYEQDPQPARFCQDHGPGHGHGHGHGQVYEQDPQPVRLRQDRVHGKVYEQHPKPVRLRQDRGHGQVYGQSSQSYPTMEMRRSNDENEFYQEMHPEEYYVENSCKDKQKCAHQSRKFSHPSSPPQFKDFGNQHFPQGAPPSTSSGVIRNDFPGRLQEVDTRPLNGYPRNPELSENLVVKEYGQRPQLEPRKGYEAVGCVNMKCLQCDPYAYSWNEHDDFVYVNAESRGKDDLGYRPHDVLYREDRAYTRADSEHRYMQRMAAAKPIADNPKKAEGSHGIYSHNGLREVVISQKEEIPVYEDSRRPFGGTPTQEADCLNSGYAPAEFDRRVSQDLPPNAEFVRRASQDLPPNAEFVRRASQDLPPNTEFVRRASQDLPLNEATVLHEHEISAYDHGRHVNVARTQGERVKSPAELVDPEDVQRVVVRENRYADEQVAYNSRMVKRKYIQDEEARGSSLGASQKWNMYNGSKHIGDCRPEWNDISSSGLHSQVPSGREPNLFLEAKDMMNEINQRKDSVRYCWSDQGQYEDMQEQSVKSFEPGRKYMRVHPKSEYSKGYGLSHYVSHRNDRYKQHYVGKRGEDETCMDSVARDRNYSEDIKGHLNYDPCEDSDNFKQSVLAAFLMFSKKLNENPPIRRLYKHQGNSGTLFCIVCGRSGSKVFRDTEGLTKHTFMARKANLRAQHLGLHRAICVLMGWGIDAPSDTIPWVPRALPQPEAMAEKEDLIIWQPTVIVHNITLSNTNHREWKVINLEAFESIIRAKNFIRSKIKICLGYPGDQSVMLVKFLGTFTGLQEAEKLHRYFAEKGRGRVDFGQAISDMNMNSGKQIDEEESLLYGYIGIAEDLDRIDLDTKKRCKIQSKREIQVLVDAPLKRE